MEGISVMRKILILLFLLATLGLVACSYFKGTPQSYKLDVECSCPDNTNPKPIIKTPEILMAQND